MASVSAVEEWVGGQHPNYTPNEIHTQHTYDLPEVKPSRHKASQRKRNS